MHLRDRIGSEVLFILKKYSKFANTVAKRGFYILLFLGISAVSITAFVMNSVRDTAREVKESLEIESSLEIPFLEEEPEFDFAEELPEKEEPQEIEEEPVIVEQKKEEKKIEAVAPKKEEAVFTMALAGAIIEPFSGEELVKSKTMDDWRIHPGVDIKGELGREVRAISDGKVLSVHKDNMLGETVTVEHSDGLMSIYANLEEGITLKQGDVIKGGDVIGKVGRSALCECLDEPHLHLEVKRDGKYIDPLSLFPEGKE